MHRYFDGDLTIKSNPLLAQLPNRVIDSLQEKIVSLTTIHVPLFPRQNIDDNDHDGYHTFEHKEDVITIENATIFCCQGLHSTCSCKQVKFRQISLKKAPKSNDYPVEGLYLDRWPYVHQGPREHDQLSNIVTAVSNFRQQQQQMPNNDNNMDELCPICLED